jgi:hypothetical protein
VRALHDNKLPGTCWSYVTVKLPGISRPYVTLNRKLTGGVWTLQAIRDSEWEVKEIVKIRTNQEQVIGLETPYYDFVRIKVAPLPQYWLGHSLHCITPHSPCLFMS